MTVGFFHTGDNGMFIDLIMLDERCQNGELLSDFHHSPWEEFIKNP